MDSIRVLRHALQEDLQSYVQTVNSKADLSAPQLNIISRAVHFFFKC